MSLTPREDKWMPDLFGLRAAGSLDLDKWVQEIEQGFSALGYSQGLSVSSDDKCVYVNADVPGLSAGDVDVSVDSEGVLTIHGERNENEEGKTFYKKSHQNFSYCVHLMDDVDLSVEPKATCKNGVMHITFMKKKEKQGEPKKINVKQE